MGELKDIGSSLEDQKKWSAIRGVRQTTVERPEAPEWLKRKKEATQGQAAADAVKSSNSPNLHNSIFMILKFTK